MPAPVDRRLLRESRAARLQLVLAGLLGALSAGLVVAQAALLAYAISAGTMRHATLTSVRPELIALAGVLLGRAAVNAAFELSGRWGAVRVMSGLRGRLARKLLLDGARNERSGELAAAAVQGVDALEAYFAGCLPQLVLAALVPLAVLGWVVVLDPVAATILAFTVPLLIGVGARWRC